MQMCLCHWLRVLPAENRVGNGDLQPRLPAFHPYTPSATPGRQSTAGVVGQSSSSTSSTYSSTTCRLMTVVMLGRWLLTRRTARTGSTCARLTPSGTRRGSGEPCLGWVAARGQGLGITWPLPGRPCRYSRMVGHSVCMILRVRWLLEVPYMVAALVCSAWLDSGYMFLRCGIHTCSTCKLTWVSLAYLAVCLWTVSGSKQSGELCTVVAAVFLPVLFTFGTGHSVYNLLTSGIFLSLRRREKFAQSVIQSLITRAVRTWKLDAISTSRSYIAVTCTLSGCCLRAQSEGVFGPTRKQHFVVVVVVCDAT